MDNATKLDLRNAKNYEPDAGEYVGEAVQNAIFIARSEMRLVKFEINGITVVVDYASIPDGIVRDYYRALNHLISDKVIGPRCEYPLSENSRMMDGVMMVKNSGVLNQFKQ